MCKLFTALSVSLTVLMAVSLSGCGSKQADPVERVNALIQAKGVNLPIIERMDSVMGYHDAFGCEMSAIMLEWHADSLLQVNIKNGTVSQNREKLIDLGNSVLSLKKKAAQETMKNELSRTPKEFVGYETVLADSTENGTSYRILLDEEMKRVAIQKLKF